MPSRIGSGPLLYAELLPNIRQITLHVSFPDSSSLAQSPTTPDTAVNLAGGKWSISVLPSRCAVSLSSADTIQTLSLPARVSEAAHTIVSTQPTPNPSGTGHGELLFRLPVDVETGPVVASRPANDLASHDRYEVQVPWTAKDMCAETRVRCRQCKNLLFIPSKEGTVMWKDLPSPDWAEMMDLWHCHKPDTHAEDHGDAATGAGLHAHDENEIVKGYGAANQVVCTPGTALIDVLSFVMAEGDCQGLEKSTCSSSATALHIGTSDPKSQPVVDLSCSRCSAIVGEEYPSLSGLRLYKANVSLLRKPKDGINSDKDAWETYPVDMIVGTQLLELAERIGARRFAVHSTEYAGDDRRDNKSGLLLWVFNPDLRYSSLLSYSTTDGIVSIASQRAMKILYQEVPDIQLMLNPAQGVPSPTALEDVSLPPSIYDDMKQALEKSSETLPISARQFREWRVGLFSRYEEIG
ncbi:hypothetical protein BDDG_11692 [Blastomyces dermatitidis ATCC 18188]|uniref:Ubiquitin-conjugating enzyme E2C-binding protein n=1 Tax=Ajellomyces dermatitidis (strain ATCC 18188 / CBS 674.68) TaxID=653446 RepID=A0A0J9HCG8_AJEDA|nr:hypothetical protein BDDG_11692 [Blastomyces dermatitidis ATCC 18188]